MARAELEAAFLGVLRLVFGRGDYGQVGGFNAAPGAAFRVVDVPNPHQFRARAILGHSLQHGSHPPVWSRLNVYKTGLFERVNGVPSICVGTVSRNLESCSTEV